MEELPYHITGQVSGEDVQQLLEKDYPFNLGSESFNYLNVTIPGVDDEPTRTAVLQWFQRGMVWLYAYHHEESIRCFERAVVLAPKFAMAYWGIAYSHSPNYNFSVENGYYEESNREDGFPSQKKAVDAIISAMMLRNPCTPVEKALIEALTIRFRWPATPYAYLLNGAFAQAMKLVVMKFPNNPDVQFVYAEALMNLRPWKMWEGSPQFGKEIQSNLEKALQQTPHHPGLCHLYIHTMEMSAQPERAVTVADALTGFVPSAGHLQHMPSHIYVLVGSYHKAVVANQQAIEGDKLCIENNAGGNFFIGYVTHDYHMLVFAAMFAGMQEIATETAKEMLTYIPHATLASSEILAQGLEAFAAVPYHVMIRFGCWDDIIKEPFPEDKELFCVTTATLHYARGVAFAALGKVPEAEKEQELFLEALKLSQIPTRFLHNNKCLDMLEISKLMLQGEIEYRKCNYEDAYEFLEEGVRLDDRLPYDEPWGQMQPVRHALGALLLEQNHYVRAAAVYREDLIKHPKNLWSLRGLLQCMKRGKGDKALQGSAHEIAELQQQLREAAQHTNIKAKTSCLCATKSL